MDDGGGEMRRREVDAAIGEAYRIDRTVVESPGLDEAKRELLARIVAEPRQEEAERAPTTGVSSNRGLGARLLRRRYLALGTAIGTATAIVLLVVGIGVGPTGSPTPALATKLRLTAVSPHVLLEAPGWRIRGASEVEGRRGSIRFFHGTGELVPYLGGRLLIAFQAAAELRWRSAPPAARVHAPGSVRAQHSDFVFVTESPTLGATARVFARSVPKYRARQYAAVWIQGGRYLKFRSFAPSLTVFERRLASLRLVSRARWLHALPTHLVRLKDWAAVEAPGGRRFVPHCGNPLPPALAARNDRPRVRFFKSFCRRIANGFAP
jgi:hypothetical protein